MCVKQLGLYYRISVQCVVNCCCEEELHILKEGDLIKTELLKTRTRVVVEPD